MITQCHLDIRVRQSFDINPFGVGTVFDICRRQILMYKDDPLTERIKIFMIAVDP